MKRLIKKANQIEKDVRIIEYWVEGNHRGVKDLDIQSIIERNQDCIYNGIAYRSIQIFGLNANSPLAEIEQHINIGKGYRAFSKSYKYLYNQANTGDVYNTDEVVIVKSNISGLDVNKFFKKYEKLINIIPYSEQEEVIAKFENFDIVYIFGNEV